MNDLLQILPLKNERVVISKKQKINDIIREVVKSHVIFAPDYLKICDEFYSRDPEIIFKKIFDFCKQNLIYSIESESDQTTKSPAAILRNLKGGNDCKHYSNFIGGILGAINEKYSMHIPWFYRFASYSYFNALPSHVFVVAKANGETFWIDPVLKEFNDRSIKPVFTEDKKIKSKNMLSRISGVEPQNFAAAVKFLNYHGAITGNGLNRDKYIKALETAPPALKQDLANSYAIVREATQRGTVGSFWDVLGNVLKGVGNAITPPPPPVPIVMPQQTNSLNQYLPYILIGGAGLVIFLTMKKK